MTPTQLLEKMIDDAFGGPQFRPPRGPAPIVPHPAAKTGPVPMGKGAPVSVTSPFGDRVHPVTHKPSSHAGVDLGAKMGDPVFAIYSGIVVQVKQSSTAGLHVVVAHQQSVTSTYMHLSATNVSQGQSVAAGTQIGSVGKSGRVTGAHLHLEIRVDGRAVPPTADQASRALGRPIKGDVAR